MGLITLKYLVYCHKDTEVVIKLFIRLLENVIENRMGRCEKSLKEAVVNVGTAHCGTFGSHTNTLSLDTYKHTFTIHIQTHFHWTHTNTLSLDTYKHTFTGQIQHTFTGHIQTHFH
jgi:hypothetical protein